MQKKIIISIVNLKCHSAIRNEGECNSVWKTIYLSCKQMSITDNQTFLQYSINWNIWVNEQCVHQSEEWLSVNVKIPISILNQSLICNRDLGGISVGYKASSEPPYASHTLVQIILHFIPKLSTQSILLKSYFWLIVCKCPYFYKKLKKHCLVQDADISKQNLPALMASEITLIWRLDPMTQLPDNEFFLWMNESKSNYINQECFSIEEIERINSCILNA